MVRRHFLNSLGLTSIGMSLPHINSNFFLAKNEFNLKYAPHFGMFKNIAGDDLFDQLNYIADQGLKIYKFERDYTSVLTYEFFRSFPLSISSMPVSYDGNNLLKCSVSMSYIRYVQK